MSVDRDLEKAYSMSEFVAKLRRLADALENGTPFSIQVDGEKIKVPRDAILSVEHEREEGNEELEFQLSWKKQVLTGDAKDAGADEPDNSNDELARDDMNSEESTELNVKSA